MRLTRRRSRREPGVRDAHPLAGGHRLPRARRPAKVEATQLLGSGQLAEGEPQPVQPGARPHRAQPPAERLTLPAEPPVEEERAARVTRRAPAAFLHEREDQPPPRPRRAADARQQRLHLRRVQIHREPFGDEQRGRQRVPLRRSRQRILQPDPPQLGGHKHQVARARPQRLTLRPLRRRMIHLDQPDARELQRQPHGERVEPGAHDHDLAKALGQRPADTLLDPALPQRVLQGQPAHEEPLDQPRRPAHREPVPLLDQARQGRTRPGDHRPAELAGARRDQQREPRVPRQQPDLQGDQQRRRARPAVTHGPPSPRPAAACGARTSRSGTAPRGRAPA